MGGRDGRRESGETKSDLWLPAGGDVPDRDGVRAADPYDADDGAVDRRVLEGIDMAVEIRKPDDQIVVLDSDLEEVVDGDKDTSYTVRTLTGEKVRELR